MKVSEPQIVEFLSTEIPHLQSHGFPPKILGIASILEIFEVIESSEQVLSIMFDVL